MGESSEVPSEENKVSPEKSKKRKLKTPSQLMALEEFYDEHFYPTEEMKSRIADETGLTEKQISGWFCHRRLKDKKLFRDGVFASGRQDRSIGVLQDHGSGVRQDSCGSNKQGEYRHVDPVEVESQRSHGQDFPPVDLAYKSRSHHYSGTVGSIDDTSSESSSASQDPQGLCPTENGAIIPNNVKGVKNMGHKPSGYLKVKGENAAISVVKRLLGKHYREDGPPPGIRFQALPPGAFESPIRNPVHEPYGDGDSALLHSQDVSRVRKQQGLSARSGAYKSKMSSRDLHMEGENCGTLCESDSQEKESHSQFKEKSSFLDNNYRFPGRNSSFDMCEDSAVNTYVYNESNDRMVSKHGEEGTRSDSICNHHQLPLYGGKLANERADHWLRKCDNISPNTVQRSDYRKSVERDDRGTSRKIPKVPKRAREEFLPRDYVTKASFADKPSWTNPIKGSAMEMPSSFSEDETADTSSSLD